MKGQMEPRIFKPEPAEIVEVKRETHDIKTFTVKYIDRKKQNAFHFLPGKFMMVSLFGFGEMPISISSSPLKTDSMQLTVRAVGNISRAMHDLKVGDLIGLRGPFGSGFPVPRFRKKNVVFVSGGCGLAPLRSAILAIASKAEEFKQLFLLHGCKNPGELLFQEELCGWEKNNGFKVLVTVDEPTSQWRGRVGLVTKLLDEISIEPENTVALIVGPPIMIGFTIQRLKEKGVAEQNIYASLERLMHCGVGKCAHCNIAGKYVCIDGPVFNGKELSKMPLSES